MHTTDSRIATMEKDLALIIQSQKEMSKNMELMAESIRGMVKANSEFMVTKERISYMDRELKESFERVHKRIDKTESALNKLLWIVATPIILAIIGSIIKTS